MIVREEPDGSLLLVRQVDHSMLSGWLAAAWGAPPWEPPSPREPAVIGARLHDYAWIPWDEALVLRPDGRPFNFLEVDRTRLAPLYERGADGVEALDAYAGLLVSLHYSGFYTSHWGWQHWGRSHLEGEARAAIERLLEREARRQQRIRDRFEGAEPALEAGLERNYKLLQLWDRISLEVCRRGGDAWDQELPAVPGPAGEPLTLRMRLEPGGVCRLDPYPLTAQPYRAAVPCVRVPAGGDVRLAWAAGGGDAIVVEFRAA